MVFIPLFSLMPSLVKGEPLALYGHKGYAYTFSPLPAGGISIQSGGMYSHYEANNLKKRDGFIQVVPISLTFGNGDLWELTATTHWEYWKNTDYDIEAKGYGDVFFGGKLLLLSQEKENPLDIAIQAFALTPSENREKSIGDLYLYNPTEEDVQSNGFHILLGKRWEKNYLVGNLGLNNTDTQKDYIKKDSNFYGITLERHLDEERMFYVEFINHENKNRLENTFCYGCDNDVDQPIRELGMGCVRLLDTWTLKYHVGVGLTKTSPDFRLFILINYNFNY